MHYPDGQPVVIGDLIWWDGAHHVGYVNSIMPPDTCTSISGFVVIGRHPYCPDHPGYADGETQYYENEFDDEGIGRLSDIERTEFLRADQIALETTPAPCVSRYTVTTAVVDNRITAWVFSFDGPCSPVRIECEWPEIAG